MFASINAQSPPLMYFPASQRVTYLYYLGRYLFSNNLFYPAQTALQAAYDQCHKQAINQQRLILTYLIPCNIILGRFPTMALLQSPEAEGLADKFLPLCQIIAKGDIASFRKYFAVDAPSVEWFARKGIMLQLRNRCEILVWRSLTRKVFILAGFHGDLQVQAQRGPPPFLYLQKLEAAVQWLNSRIPSTRIPSAQALAETGGLQEFPVDPDIAQDGEANNQATDDSNFEDYFNPDVYFDDGGEPVQVHDVEDLPIDELTEYEISYEEVFTSLHGGSENPEENKGAEDQDIPSPLMRELEAILSSLLTQDLMRGYLTHKNPRYAIPGARYKGALPTGFPNVWQTIYAREREDDEVPGWVKPPDPFAGGGIGGRVVNLSGAKSISEMAG